MPESIRSSADEISLREHLERIINGVGDQSEKDLIALRRELDIIQGFTKEAGLKADKADAEWRKAANEWRNTYTDLVTRYATSAELEAMEKHLVATAGADRLKAEAETKTLEIRISLLESWKNNMQGRLWGVPMIIGVVVFIITQLMRVLFPAAK